MDREAKQSSRRREEEQEEEVQILRRLTNWTRGREEMKRERWDKTCWWARTTTESMREGKIRKEERERERAEMLKPSNNYREGDQDLLPFPSSSAHTHHPWDFGRWRKEASRRDPLTLSFWLTLIPIFPSFLTLLLSLLCKQKVIIEKGREKMK